MQEIFALITAAGHLTNVAKTAFQTQNKVETDKARIELGEAIIELQSKISALQMSYQTLWELNESLKKQVATFDKWDTESAHYVLTRLGDGAFFYKLKQPQPDETDHALCANCWEDRRKSILQNTAVEGEFQCPKCKTTIIFHRNPPSPMFSAMES